MLINGENHNDLCVGIDLGTTNSVLATITPRANGNIVSKVIGIDRAVDMFNAGGETRFSMRKENTLPSCVYYNEEKNFAPVVGNFAKSRYSLRPHLVAKSIKSQMGNAFAEGLSSNIPDKTPAQISARILEYMLKSAARTYHQKEIDDAVITVPANFDSIMCQATLKAAELAGIKIRNADGSMRSILLPEPQAVIYDFINQVHNGEISDKILDLSTQKIVMVFDLGGGTLDITLHKISRRKDAPEVLNVEDLAINRYTLLGGDDFDAALAKEMFVRYLEKYRSHPEIFQKIKREEAGVMPQLLNYAEELKIKVSMDNSDEFGGGRQDDDAWGDDDDTYPVGGNIGATGYAYDDNFTTQALEDVWNKFMGNDFKFDDFKNLDEVAKKFGTLNIIFPILDVLKKCSDKLGTENFKIDAVIMNGGMSRFYMVINRLKEFFGFDPIVALDPDQAVARGAAVYHYFLHKYDEALAKDPAMKNLPLTSSAKQAGKNSAPPAKNPMPYIRPGHSILPDSLYLVTHGNRYEEIIKTGTTLPHRSEIFTGFKLPSGTNKINVPIARRNNDGSYTIIAGGNIVFPEKYSRSKNENFAAFTVTMNEQRIIRMDAYTCKDPQGLEKIDDGTTEIAIATKIDKPVEEIAKPKIVTTKPLKNLNPVQVLNRILEFCKKADSAQKRGDKNNFVKYSELIRREKQNLWTADNPNDFAETFLKIFKDNENLSNEIFKTNFIIIGRKIGKNWTASQKKRLANFCMQQLDREIHFHGFDLKGYSVNTKIQAVYTLNMCGSENDLAQLENLHGYSKLRLANLYTHAMTKTSVDWIYLEFKKDCNLIANGKKSLVQNSAHALGVAYRLSDGEPTVASVRKSKIVSDLCKIIRSKKMNSTEINNCLLAIGLLCDRRYPNPLEQSAFNEAQKLLNDLNSLYPCGVDARFEKSATVAQKMLQGGELSAEEEEFLLIKLDD